MSSKGDVLSGGDVDSSDNVGFFAPGSVRAERERICCLIDGRGAAVNRVIESRRRLMHGKGGGVREFIRGAKKAGQFAKVLHCMQQYQNHELTKEQAIKEVGRMLCLWHS